MYDVLGWLAAGMSFEEVLNDFPELDMNDIRACLAFAADRERKLQIASWNCDSDFYDLALVRGIPPKIIWIRNGNLSTSELGDLLVEKYQIILSFMSGKEAIEENTCLELWLI